MLKIIWQNTVIKQYANISQFSFFSKDYLYTQLQVHILEKLKIIKDYKFGLIRLL